VTAAAAARPDAIRRHNLALVLSQVHRDGALTRAELTQRLGLSRSTIGALVADLSELGLVEESVPSGGTRAGRPSHVVGPHSAGPFVVAVDVDVAHITAAAVGIGGNVLARHVISAEPSPPTPEFVVERIATSIPLLRKEIGRCADPVAVGVSVPGTVHRYLGRVGFAPNLHWRNAEFGAMLADLLEPAIPVAVGNDADLAVLAEHSRGVARDSDDVVFLMGRIGVGAGIIVNGAPLRGHDGHAGEIGHTVVDASGPPCHCGKRGCLETFVGENALLTLAGEPIPATDERVRAVFDDARAGRGRALAAVREVAASLGRGLAGLVNALNPERLVLGGSFADVLDIAAADVEQTLHQYAMDAPGDPVQLTQPCFGTDSALLGAAEVAFAPLLVDPLAGRALARR